MARRQEDPGEGEASSEAGLDEGWWGAGSPGAGHARATATSRVLCGHSLPVTSITGGRWPSPRASQGRRASTKPRTTSSTAPLTGDESRAVTSSGGWDPAQVAGSERAARGAGRTAWHAALRRELLFQHALRRRLTRQLPPSPLCSPRRETPSSQTPSRGGHVTGSRQCGGSGRLGSGPPSEPGPCPVWDVELARQPHRHLVGRALPSRGVT